jgi:hypothetical protein
MEFDPIWILFYEPDSTMESPVLNSMTVMELCLSI